MSGVSVTFLGSGSNVFYTNGLVRKQYSGYAGTNPNFADALSPFGTSIDTAPAQIFYSGSPNYTAIWTGYLRPTVTGSNTLAMSIFASDCDNFNFLWVGPQAISGYSGANALLSGSGTVSGSVSLIAGQYVPIRIQLAYDGDSGFFDDPELSFTFLVNGSTSYNVFYNSLTQGF